MNQHQQRALIKLNTIYDAIEFGKLEVSEWEHDFIDSVNEQNSKKKISWKQSKKLNEIWEKIK